MSKKFQVEREDSYISIRILRKLDLVETLEVIDEVARTENCNRRLWDLTKNFSFSTSEIQSMANRGRKHWPNNSRVTYLAADDLAFGLLRMFEVYREQDNYQTKVFRDRREAVEWLKEWSG